MKKYQTNTKKYQFICTTDLYHAHRHREFNKFTGIKVIDTFDTLKEANEALFKGLKEDAEQYIDNWGLACIHANRTSCWFGAGTLSDGTRYYNYDVYRYSVREVNEEIEIPDTLDEFADAINSADEWRPLFNEIIEENGWKDNTGTEFDICESATEILEFDERGVAIVRAKEA